MTFFDYFRPREQTLASRFAAKDDVSASMAGDPATIAAFLNSTKNAPQQGAKR